MNAYLTSCRTLSLDRTCSPVPVLSYPSASSSSTRLASQARAPISAIRRERTEEEKLAKINLKNALQAGKSPKKEHEVDSLSQLGSSYSFDYRLLLLTPFVVADIQAEERLTHCVDVGSGRVSCELPFRMRNS